MVLRSWTVGVGELGRLHTDPRVYESALGDIDSPALVVSTKFTAGDFFSYLPLNPTLRGGRHRRLVELQAKPEFEGFGALPDFLGDEHARALRTLRAANPLISGTYLLTRFGGPLRAGPRTLYPLHGFWLWTDANVFVDSRLALDPDANVRELARQWAQVNFARDDRIVDAIVNVLTRSREAILEGYYIRAFAEREVRVPGLELPPTDVDFRVGHGGRLAQPAQPRLAASVGPVLSGATVMCALMAYVGPLGFWYWFWTSAIFRIALVTFAVAVMLWTVVVMVEARRGRSLAWSRRRPRRCSLRCERMLVSTSISAANRTWWALFSLPEAMCWFGGGRPRPAPGYEQPC
jgi:hypothetical protein